MKYFVIVVSLVLFFSCQQICDSWHKVNASAATKMNIAWKCDLQKTKDFLNTIPDKTICVNHKGILPISMIAKLACNLMVSVGSQYGAVYLHNKLDCDASLVKNTLGQASGVCTILGFVIP